MAISKTDVINMFNSRLRDLLTPASGTAVWYKGNSAMHADPDIYNNAALGARPEATIVAADLDTPFLASTVFNVLHGLAMRFTRCRQGRFLYQVGTVISAYPSFAGTTFTAFDENLALYFPIPGGQVPPGDEVEQAELESFLDSLKNLVNERRTASVYTHTFNACHSDCHSSCHGSRGRR